MTSSGVVTPPATRAAPPPAERAGPPTADRTPAPTATPPADRANTPAADPATELTGTPAGNRAEAVDLRRTQLPRLRRLHYEPETGPLGTEPAGAGSPGDPAPVATAAAAPAAGPRSGADSTRPGSTAPPASRAEHIDAHHAAARQLRTALEVLDGRRPLAHLADQVAPPVLRYWRAAAQQRRMRGPARFTRLRLCLPRRGIAEVAATCHIDGRPRALAARFEWRSGRWLCTAVRLG